MGNSPESPVRMGDGRPTAAGRRPSSSPPCPPVRSVCLSAKLLCNPKMRQPKKGGGRKGTEEPLSQLGRQAGRSRPASQRGICDDDDDDDDDDEGAGRPTGKCAQGTVAACLTRLQQL